MKTSKRTVVTIETHRVMVIHSPERLLEDWCQQCGARVKLVRPEIAARLSGLSCRTLYRLIETGQVHFTQSPTESSEDLVLVCLESLTNGGCDTQTRHNKSE